MAKRSDVQHGPEVPDAQWFAAGTIARKKIGGYLLSPTHEVGKGKLRKWRSAFGIGEGDGELLERLIRTQLHRATITERPPEPYPPEPGRFIRSFTLVITDFQGPNGRVANVEMGWALDPDEDVPHLVTAYPKWAPGERRSRRS